MSKELGDIAEIKAASYLESIGYTIVDTNYYTRFGEIDIIAIRSDTLHFVEVKSGLDFERAVQNITPKKISRILKTADVYLKKHALTCNYQIDAVIVVDGVCEYLESITL